MSAQSDMYLGMLHQSFIAGYLKLQTQAAALVSSDESGNFRAAPQDFEVLRVFSFEDLEGTQSEFSSWSLPIKGPQGAVPVTQVEVVLWVDILSHLRIGFLVASSHAELLDSSVGSLSCPCLVVDIDVPVGSSFSNSFTTKGDLGLSEWKASLRGAIRVRPYAVPYSGVMVSLNRGSTTINQPQAESF